MTWIVWALLSAVFAAATALLAKVGVEAVDSNLATAIRTTVVLVFTWTLALSLNAHRGLGIISRRSWIFLVLSGICTGLSWLCYFHALQMGPVSGVAPSSCVEKRPPPAIPTVWKNDASGSRASGCTQ